MNILFPLFTLGTFFRIFLGIFITDGFELPLGVKFLKFGHISDDLFSHLLNLLVFSQDGEEADEHLGSHFSVDARIVELVPVAFDALVVHLHVLENAGLEGVAVGRVSPLVYDHPRAPLL